MKEVNYRDVAPIVLEKLAEGGVFLTVKDRKGRVNTMNIGWGQRCALLEHAGVRRAGAPQPLHL